MTSSSNSQGRDKGQDNSSTVSEVYVQLDAIIDQQQYEAVSNSLNHIIIFTTRLNPELIEFLSNDYNFEISLRLIGDIKEQAKISSIKDRGLKFKALIQNLFTTLILNYLNHNHRIWDKISFTYNQYGKPSITGQSFAFNSSSSNNIISMIVEYSSSDNAGKSIGIDLSHSAQNGISPTNFMNEFKPIFSENEFEVLGSVEINHQYYMFNHIWTLKESFTKLLGCGLNINLSEFGFDIKQSLDYNNETDVIGQGYTNKNNNVCFGYILDWKKDIEINVDKLIENKNKFLLNVIEEQQLQRPQFHIRSAILQPKSSEQLPVVISFINQNQHIDISNFEINFLNILNKYVQ